MTFLTIRRSAVALVGVLALSTAGCASAPTTGSGSNGSGAGTDSSQAFATVWDASTVHSFSVEFEQAQYDAMIATYLDSGDKDWISATVTIDGTTFEDVGLRLKGNSSLRGLSVGEEAETSADRPESLPWLIRLDKFVGGRSLDGTVDFVIRANSSETALNEALALDLLTEAGLASENAISARVSMNGSDAQLRLIIENPDDAWMSRELGDGLLYKAESGGDYDYRGDDASAYADIFDQEAGDDDIAPLASFLKWINSASDDEFAADLDDHLDVDAFATYLAFQDLIGNRDDIDGRGNNSYLYYDPDTALMTVVSWDLNLAFGQSNVGGRGADAGAAAGDGLRGNPGAAPAGPGDGAVAPPEDGGRGGEGVDGANILATRFLAVSEFLERYEDVRAALQVSLFDSGLAAQLLTRWTETLESQASDLVDASVVVRESAVLVEAFPS